jgi:predicted GNAT superfamily acetyltransferase
MQESGSAAIRDAMPGDHAAILALNHADVAYTSPMDAARLVALDALSCYHRVVCVADEVAGFLLAMRSGAPYENDNFAWFASRYPSFVYVDRVVIASAARGLHLASRLYEDLFGWARGQGIPLVTCEYNIVPANEPSRRFHDKFGFTEKGTQWVANGSKQVSLQAAETRLPRRPSRAAGFIVS